MKQVKKYFVILPLLLLLTACGKSDIPEIDEYIWQMTSIQSSEANGGVIAYDEEWSADAVEDGAVELDMDCSAKNGILTLTDHTNEVTYTGSYVVSRKNPDGAIYNVTLNGQEGVAVTGMTTYSNETKEATFIINLGEYTINFFTAQ